ncbi:uncharacterized protein LOC112271861 [Brachypodium distachyon]|uniref:uncharacterized protein LOC112271861 n=1 Tax=Brachypodium distachyon TaxID=15368 RepID=UPI000D0CB37C|nr:uncharacterized protein LOC112271861 [Brachypodium distachyon]|eukprot:XP_024317834.1 uncharacterized protein LOC112271861 [Brachypodium distachyon]
MDDHPAPNRRVANPGVGANQQAQGGNNPLQLDPDMRDHPAPTEQSRANPSTVVRADHTPNQQVQDGGVVPRGRPSTTSDQSNLQAQLADVQAEMADLKMQMQRDREERVGERKYNLEMQMQRDRAEREYSVALQGWLQNYVDLDAPTCAADTTSTWSSWHSGISCIESIWSRWYSCFRYIARSLITVVLPHNSRN